MATVLTGKGEKQEDKGRHEREPENAKAQEAETNQ
jgi:hypothetical protein